MRGEAQRLGGREVRAEPVEADLLPGDRRGEMEQQGHIGRHLPVLLRIFAGKAPENVPDRL